MRDEINRDLSANWTKLGQKLVNSLNNLCSKMHKNDTLPITANVTLLKMYIDTK